ncbi:NAD(P)/FAD-dependent oxidoreductase [Halalkalicoccus jeotgali]|uniref:FAD dependent oxidoreductase n=1 Tax=Halalkalicoccus jeotgali (strain DSM 18796 / CECT 7217 / JCM 14584 / KCTC 4019 / B3) TaxID=795797 RepID=D8JB98_HALJB|nr:FAD-binding oxidoreductase [Halalkalicoccus jeotgali]ADJ16551.1 FAD dependent oxidoreductase [Halalkalicoccus jeotgali B3]ELY41353.1 FAD dependent oxidoreductase [Halalkalicoccus jeotgali B3]
MSTVNDRVVVVGAGVSGLAVARELAPDHDVIVLDKGGVAADTSSRASGMISLSLEPFPDEWASFALSQFRDLDGQGIFSFTERETVRLVPEANVDLYTDQAPDGGEFLTRSELERRFPDSFGDLSAYGGGLVYDGTGSLDALDYAMTLKWAAEQAGAAIFRDHEVTDLRVEGGTVTGVETEYGCLDADHVVYATGWKTRDLLAEYVDIPARPLRWNAVVIEPDEPLPAVCPMGSEPTLRVYWRLTDRGNVLVGGNEHLLSDPDGTPMGVQPSFRERVVEDVAPLLSGVAAGRIRREDCCPTADCASPDGLPVIDAPTEGPEGLVIVTGLHGRGVMLSPVTGRAVRSLVTSETPPFPMAQFRLDRFEDRSADFDYRSHWGPGDDSAVP